LGRLFVKEPAIGKVEIVPAEAPRVAWDADHLYVEVTYPCGCQNAIPVLADGALRVNSSIYTSCAEAWCAFGWDDAELHARQFLEVIGRSKLVREVVDE